MYEVDIDRDDILTRITTEYDDLLQTEDDKLKYYFNKIRIFIALSSGKISLKDAYASLKYIDDHPEATMGGIDQALFPWSEETISHLIKNIRIMKRSDLYTTENVYNAIRDAITVQLPHIPPSGFELDVFNFFVRNPLAPLSEGVKSLSSSRSALETAYSRLEELHRIRSLGYMEYSSFGLRSCMLFFQLKPDVDWNRLRDSFLEFPFIKVLHTDVHSSRGFVSFTIPDNSSNMRVFTDSVKTIVPKLFQYSSYHIIKEGGRFMNPTLVEVGKWNLPPSVNDTSLFDSESKVGRCFIAFAKGFRDRLTEDDFYVAETYNLDLRTKPSIISDRLESKGWNMDSRQVSYRKNKLLDSGAMHPWLWFSRIGLHYSICVEISCNEEWQEKLINAFSYFPEVFYYRSDRGVVFWIETPMYHLVDYHNFLQGILTNEGVKSVHPIFTIYRSGGKTLLQVVKDYEFGKRGFADASDDVDLRDYIKL